jgi:hypothetical protein
MRIALRSGKARAAWGLAPRGTLLAAPRVPQLDPAGDAMTTDDLRTGSAPIRRDRGGSTRTNDLDPKTPDAVSPPSERGRAKDDPSRAPESGDKPDAAQPGQRNPQ